MALAIGDTAPDFEAETTEGKIRFHNWLGNSWGVLFSHPKDFTPVCTTELGTMARLKPEFDKRNTKIIGLSVDPVDNHKKWSADIKDVVGFAPNYPMIGDTDLKISKAYGMLPAATSGTSEGRTAADNQTVRNVFIVGPDKKIKLILVYPMTTGRNLGVRGVVAGEFIRSGNDSLLHLELVDVSDGTQLWGAQVKFVAPQVLEHLEEIVEEISRQLSSIVAGGKANPQPKLVEPFSEAVPDPDTFSPEGRQSAPSKLLRRLTGS